jgi:hypothetical protein
MMDSRDRDEVERRMAWDELDEDGRQRRHERLLEYADFRRKELKEDALIRSMEGTEGQDRENYTDTQDRENYTTEQEKEVEHGK